MESRRRSAVSVASERLGFDYSENDSADTKQLRTLAVSGAAANNHPYVVKELVYRFAQYLETGNDSGIAADLERAVYKTAVEHGGRKEYNAMKKIYVDTQTPSRRNAAIAGLCASKNTTLVEETLKFALNEGRDQDLYLFFSGLASNVSTRRKLSEFVMANYDEIFNRFSVNSMLPRLIAFAFESLTQIADANEIEDFFKDKDVSKFVLAYDQTLDTIRAHAALLERSTDEVAHWLDNWKNKAKN